MDGQTTVDAALVTKLTAHASLTTIDIYKNLAAPILNGAFPYILLENTDGGLRNDSPHDVIDTLVLVTAVSTTMPQAQTYSGYIEEALKNQTLVFSGGWVSWSTVRQIDFFASSINIQNTQYHKVGAIYRIRATKAKG